MAALDTFLARLLPRAMGAEDPVARQALVDAAIDFCERTLVVQQVLTPINVVAAQASYTLSLSTDLAVAQVRRAWYLGAPLGPVADDSIGSPLAYLSDVGDGEVEAETGPPSVCLWHENKLRLYPIPTENKTEGLVVRVAVKPTTDAAALPDELLTHWREAIVHGALERVLNMRGSAHYDPQAADRSGTQFAAAVAKAKAMARTGRVPGELSVTMRPFA